MIEDLESYCENCRKKQNQNYHDFGKDYKARREADDKIKTDFMNEVADYFGYAGMNEEIKQRMFNKAWGEQHSYGYNAVAEAYDEHLELAQFIIDKTKNAA